jgi:glycosyltransferase involved in cell wall biosynthesis
MPPKVSVNICCYNCEKFIYETIQSVLSQTFKDYEIIIIDDGSKDKTQEIIKSFSDPRVKYYYQKNQGTAASRNKAVELSNGEYIALLDHDDLWEPKKLEMQVAHLEANPKVGLVYSDAYIIQEGKAKHLRFFELTRPHRGKVTLQLLKGDFVHCLTTVIRKDLVKKAGYFSREFNFAEEYELYLRLSLLTEFDFINQPLARYRVHSTNLSRNIRLAVLDGVKAIEKFYNNNKEALRGVSIVKKRMKQIKVLKLIFSLSFNEKRALRAIGFCLIYIYLILKDLKRGVTLIKKALKAPNVLKDKKYV